METTEIKVPLLGSYTIDELKSIIQLAFGNIESYSTDEKHHIFQLTNFRFSYIAINVLLRKGGYNSVIFNGETYIYNPDLRPTQKIRLPNVDKFKKRR